MYWTPLNFSNHAGKTLPEVIFEDPGWFAWAYDKGVLEQRGHPAGEVEELYQKMSAIKIPQGKGQGYSKLVPSKSGSVINLLLPWQGNKFSRKAYKLAMRVR